MICVGCDEMRVRQRHHSVSVFCELMGKACVSRSPAKTRARGRFPWATWRGATASAGAREHEQLHVQSGGVETASASAGEHRRESKARRAYAALRACRRLLIRDRERALGRGRGFRISDY